MNVKRFAARTSRDALALVRQEFGTDAVVLSTKPCDEGVEVLAMAPEGMAHVQRLSETAPKVSAAAQRATAPARERDPAPAAPARAARAMPAASGADAADAAQMRFMREPGLAAPKARPHADVGQVGRQLAAADAEIHHQAALGRAEVEQDADELAMSTLSFQDYVRQRMLKRRHAELHNQPMPEEEEAPAQSARASLVQIASARAAADQRRAANAQMAAPRRMSMDRMERPAPPSVFDEMADDVYADDDYDDVPAPRAATRAPQQQRPAQRPQQRAHLTQVPVLHDEVPPAHVPRAMPRLDERAIARAAQVPGVQPNQLDMVNELRSMKGLIEERFGALAFMEKLQRQPRQALLAQKMLDSGFSPALIRKMVDALPATATDETAWAASVLERNLATGEAEASIEDQGGVFALIGSTGVGKTTSTAKIAAGFAAKHGANQLGLITLDAYRVGAHEQLRAYGRILGVPVHTAHDRASLEDLLELLANKKMVLIDTAGMAQRDSRTRDLLEMLSHRSIKRLLVIDSAAQGETIEDVIVSWRAAECKGVILSKIDEAVKLAPALDALIRHKLKTVGVANGQRVPEDWHRLSANALVHRAMKGGGHPAWRMDPQDVHLVFANAGLNTNAAASLRI